MRIVDISCRKILNSNTNYTIEVKVHTGDGIFRGSSPAGESTSQYEVKQFKLSLDSTVSKFNAFISKLKGREIVSMNDIYSIEREVPEEFIGGPSLSLSYALMYALSYSLKQEPYQLLGGKHTVLPICKMIGGGVHTSDLGMDIQEILVTTLSDNLEESLDGTIAVYNEVKRLLSEKTLSYLGAVDPEGGLVSALDNYESLKIVDKAVGNVIERTGLDIRMGIDAAASTFYRDEKYVYKKPLYGKKELTRQEQIDLMIKLANEFNLYYVEDPVDENFSEGYKEIMNHIDGYVVADDLTATETGRLERLHGSINATLIKPNQVGLVWKFVEYSKLADKYNLLKIVSHRSEETNIGILSDIAVGLGARHIKIGINRGERIEKLNRLMELE